MWSMKLMNQKKNYLLPVLFYHGETVDESVGINAEGTVDNDLNLNGGDTNHNESKSDLLSTDSNVDDIPVKMIQMPMKN